MKSVLKVSLGFNIAVAFYETAAEFDNAAKVVGASLDTANLHLWFHQAADDAREAVAEAVEAITGIKRLERDITTPGKDIDPATGQPVRIQVKNAAGEVETEYTQNEAVYVEYALAKAGKTPAQLQDQVADYISKMTEEVDGKVIPLVISVNAAKKERKAPQPKKLPTKFLEIAKTLIPNIKKFEGFAKDFAKLMGTPLVEEQKTNPEKLGWAIKGFFDKKQADLAAALS